MNKADMIEVLVNYYCDGNKTKFAAKLGVKPQTINTWISRNTFDTELIFAKCEGVNAEWLLTGEGETFDNSITQSGDQSGASINGDVTINAAPPSADCAKLEQRIADLEQILKEKDNLVAEKERVISEKQNLVDEKERLIRILLARQNS